MKIHLPGRFLSLLLTFLISAGPDLKAQTCASPTVLSFGVPVNNLSTCGKGNPFDQEDACGNTYMNGEDYVFTYTPTTAGVNDCVSIQLASNGTVGTRGLFVFSGCPDAPGTVCIAQNIALQTNTGTSIENLLLSVGTTYRIVVSSNNGCHAFNIAVVAGSCSSVPAGATCLNAKEITSLPYNLPGQSTATYRNDYNEGNIGGWPGSYLNGDDYVFKYTPAANIVLGISLANTGAYAGLFVMKGCPSDPSSTLVASNVSSSTVSPSIPSVALNAGETYYFLVSTNGFYAATTTFDISVAVSAVNSCFNPTDISFGSTITNRTTCGAGDQFDQYDACGNRYMNGEDYVFRYTTSSSNPSCVNIDMTGPAYAPGLPVAGIDRCVFVFDGCPDDPSTSCIAQGSLGTSSSIKNLKLLDNKTYYIVASSTDDCYGPFSLSVGAGACPTPPQGTSCVNPHNVTSIPFTKSALTTCGAYKDFNSGNMMTNGAYMNGEDYVFTYTPATNVCIGIKITNNLSNTGLFVMNACPNEPYKACIASAYVTNATTPLEIPYVALGAGQTYYIIVSSNGTTTPCTAFDIKIDYVPCCGVGSTCLDPKVIPSLPFSQAGGSTCGACADYTREMGCGSSNLGQQDFVYSYTAPKDECIVVDVTWASSYNTRISIFDGCPGDPSTNCITRTTNEEWYPKLVASVDSGKRYFIIISNATSNCNDYNITIKPLAPGSPGVTCANPFLVGSLPFIRTGMTTACSDNDYTATNYYTGAPCTNATGSMMNGEDFVLKYVSPGSELINIALNNTNRMVSFYVIYGCPGDPSAVCVASRNTSDANPSLCGISLANAGTYYIIIDSHQGFTPFDISIENPPVINCASPLVISSLPFSSKKVSTKCMGDKFRPNIKCGGAAMAGEDIIYAYTAAGAEKIKITLSNTSINTGVYVFDGCPDSPATTCLGSAMSSNPYLCSINLPAAGTYYIVVDRNSGFTEFDIDIEQVVTTGFTCATPISIPSLPYYKENLTTKCSVNDYTFTTLCAGTAMNGEDVVYTYTPAANEVVNVYVSNTAANAGVFLLNGCPSSPATGCVAWSRMQNPFLCQVSLSAGVTYYLVVDHATGITEYNILVEAVDPRGVSCSNPFPIPSLPFTKTNGTTQCYLNDYQPNAVCGAAAIGPMNGEDFVFQYTAAGPEAININVTKTNGSIGLYVLNACPGTNILNCVASATGMNPFLCSVSLPAAGTYYIIIDRPTLSTGFTIFVEKSNQPGMSFANPYPVPSLPFDGTFTTTCYGNEYNASHTCNNANINGPDYVFRFTLTSTECIRITGNKFSRKGGIIITDGDPTSPLTQCKGQVNCTNLAGCNEIFTDVNLGPGTYYVVVGSDDGLGANLNFGLSIRKATYDATITYPYPYFCTGHSPAMLSAADLGGVWSGPGITDPSKGIFDPLVAGNGVHNIIYTMGGGACVAADKDTLKIIVNDSLCSMYFCNFGFDRGNFDGWKAYIGACCPVSSLDSGVTTGRHMLMTRTDTDPYIGSAVAPLNRPYSARLGNNGTGAQAERLVYKLPVTQPFIGFNYAVVLQDPGHSPAEQPRFEVTVRDQSGSVVNCGYVSFVPGTNTPGFITEGDVKYKNWSAAVFNLAPYIGQTVTFDLRTGDCAQGGHFGYAFIDGICEKIISGNSFCEGADSVVLVAPPGYYGYLWSNGSTKETAVIKKPKGGDTVKVTLTPSIGLGCPVTIPIVLEATKRATVNAGGNDTICSGQTYTLAGSMVETSTIVWKTTGTGTFDNNKLWNATYTPSAADIAAGKVRLILTSPDMVHPCPAFNDTMELVIKSCAAVPLGVLSFNAARVPDGVLLKWTVTKDRSNHYTVERSSDAEQFTAVGTVKSTGNQRGESYYSFTDRNPLPGLSYYRLKQAGNNGATGYSRVVSVSVDLPSPGISNIYPNPVKDELTCQFFYDGSEAVVEVEVLDISGNSVIREKQPARTGDNMFRVDVSMLPKGTYFLRVSNSTYGTRAPFVIK